MKTSQELQDAVQAYQLGKQDSFNTIYEQSYQYLHTCVIHVVKNEDAAMDMLQETYMEISRSILQLRNTEDFLNWAAMIANRKCFAYLKKQKDVLLYDDGGDDEENGDLFDTIADDEAFIPEEILQDREKQRLMREIIDGLSDMQRLCIIGYYYNEQKQEEIAQELGIPVNTVKTNLSRAKAKIKDAVVELDEKKGTRLYSLAPFMLLFFGAEAEACEAAPASICQKVQANYGTTSQTAGTLAEGTAQVTAGSAKSAGMALKTKIIIGAVIAGVAVVGAGTAIGLSQEKEVDIWAGDDSEEDIEAEYAEATVAEAETAERSEIMTEESTEETTVSEEKSFDALAISGEYMIYKTGNQGLIPVCNDEGKYGLVTYDNQVVVPFEYTDSCEMVNSEGQSFFGNDTGNHVFDRNGNELFHTEYPIVSVNDGVVFATKGDGVESGFIYYSLDGNVLYGAEDSDYAPDNGAVSLSEGYAVFMDTRYDTMCLKNDGTLIPVAKLLYPEEQDDEDSDTSGVNATGSSFVMDVPIGAVKEGYYLAKWVVASIDVYGIYSLTSVDGADSYSWDISSLYSYANLQFSTSDVRWGLPGFWENGVEYYSYGSYVCAYLYDWENDKKTYYLVDTARLQHQKYDPSFGTTDEEYLDFDWTVITDESLIAEADNIVLSSENYWLIQQGDQCGYIDHEGNVMGMYEDAATFHNGKALIIEDGIAYVIDESFTKIKELGPATGVTNMGEVFSIKTENSYMGELITIE